MHRRSVPARPARPARAATGASRRPRARRTIATALLAALGAAAALPRGAAAQAAPAASPVRARTAYEDLQMFSQVLNLVRVNHADSVAQHAMVMAAVRGMLAAADPHSYVSAAVRLDPAVERQWREGKLLPVPVQWSFRGSTPVVVGVLPGTAAARADVLPGDELRTIDGKPVEAAGPLELEFLLAGPRHSVAKLGLARTRVDGSRVAVEREVRRERGGEQSAVPTAFLLAGADRTGYVRVTTFDHPKVADDLQDALDRLEKEGMTRLVLDLRDNPGGLVREASQVAGAFLPRGAVVYTQRGRKPDLTDTARVGRAFWSRERRLPVVVLVNEGSASAAELVAGALQDHDRALVVGRPTFGKSLLMQGFPLLDGSLLYLVVGTIATPCGRAVQRAYREVDRTRYYEDAGTVVDTSGRPSCRTTGGRTVYGGGGIYPDVVLDAPGRAPAWYARLAESGALLAWAGAHAQANAAAYPSLEALAAKPALAPGALDELRRLAAARGVPVPTGADVDALLTRAALRYVADARWGDAGWYRLAAVQDGAVARAVEAFPQAAALLR